MITPSAAGKSCQLGGRKTTLPSTMAAPRTAPRDDESPPTAVEVKTTRLAVARNDVSWYDWVARRSSTPARPAMKPESANAVSLAHTMRTP